MKTITFPSFYGNDAVLEALRSSISSGHVTHAYLLEGPKGSGKRTLARLVAAAICCTDPLCAPCGKCRACKTIMATPIQSPDVHALGFDEAIDDVAMPLAEEEENERAVLPKKPKRRTIGVEAIRALKEDVYVIPTELEKKIYLIAHAERMTEQAQNALLKILEEPPSSVVFFLLCETRNALLPTIRSRVQTLRMETFDDDTLSMLLQKHSNTANEIARRDEARFALAVRLSGGTYGGALSYLILPQNQLSSDPLYDAHITAETCLSVVFSDAQGNGSLLLGGDLPSNLKPTKTALGMYLADRADKRERLSAVLTALAASLRDIAVCMHMSDEDKPALLFFAHPEQPMALSERVPTEALFAAHREISDLLLTMDSNPNVALLRDMLAEILLGLRLGQS